MRQSVLVLTVMLTLISCNTDQAEEQKPAGSQEMAEERVRPAAKGGTSAAYFSYTNSSSISDTLLFVESPVAGVTQIHESYETEDGMMGMRPGEEIILPPNKSVTFEQGGLHIMLMSLQENLVEGDSVVIELVFSQSGLYTKKLPVKP